MRAARRITLCLLLLGGFAIAGKIESDSDNTANFSSYKTYAWGNNFEPHRAAAKMTIVGAIEQELEGRGLKQTEVEHADIIIRYQVATDADMNFGVAVDPTYAAFG